MNRLLSRRLLFASGIALIAGIARAGDNANPLPELKWKPVFEGITRTEFRLEAPRLIHAFALRIDLQAPGIEFMATPDNGDKAGETDGQKTTSFLKAHRLQAAINASPYGPVVNVEGKAEDVSGLHVSQGKVVSPAPKQGLPALIITKENKARITGTPLKDSTDAWNAVCGFSIVLQGGEVVPGSDDLHPRTAAGVSADGRWLTWLVVDGRQRGYSGGAKTAELGTWLKAMGCAEGINLDGGGTSTLVMESPGGPQILNRPIHAGKPGNERVSGSHLGVRAAPLAKSAADTVK